MQELICLPGKQPTLLKVNQAPYKVPFLHLEEIPGPRVSSGQPKEPTTPQKKKKKITTIKRFQELDHEVRQSQLLCTGK